MQAYSFSGQLAGKTWLRKTLAVTAFASFLTLLGCAGEPTIQTGEGAEVIEEWEFFYGLAQRLGLQLDIRGRKLDMQSKPTSEELIELLFVVSRIPLDEVKRYPNGHVFDDPPVLATPREEGWQTRLDVGSTRAVRDGLCR